MRTHDGRSSAAAVLLLTALAAAQQPEAIRFKPRAPLGLPAALPAPADNPLTEKAFTLGRRLFFDPVLSKDRSVSCASCHRPDHGFSSPERRPVGAGGRRALRHAPALLNRAFGKAFRWDGKTKTLEAQVLLPIQDPNEMNLALDQALARLCANAQYRETFVHTFGAPPDRRGLSRALSSFVRGLTSGGSPVDRFLAGDRTALSTEERAGMWIYESKGHCWRCHVRPNFTNEGFQNTGIGVRAGMPEPGRAAVTGKPSDRGKFKIPTLRGLGHTAPYMHDGSLATLEDVVAFYRRGGHPNPTLSAKITPLELSDADARHLVAFLRALTPR